MHVTMTPRDPLWEAWSAPAIEYVSRCKQEEAEQQAKFEERIRRQSANAGKSQPVETPEESAKNKESEKS
jgi:hypothetical protein